MHVTVTSTKSNSSSTGNPKRSEWADAAVSGELLIEATISATFNDTKAMRVIMFIG